MTTESEQQMSFQELGISAPVLNSLEACGYTHPTPIQAASIPPILDGQDIIAQAQTGTGKTAAFALPLLSMLSLEKRAPQVLVLTPTRELALQVTDNFKRYATELKKLNILALYGGQEYRSQLRELERGAQIIIGTPGRVMDHIRRGSLKLDNLETLVLDEADEMLRMGFIDDVEWVIQQTPENRQIALFSATMPSAIRRIAQQYLRTPEEITIQQKTATAAAITQRYWLVGGLNKLDALSRMMEVEPFDGMIIFVRTRQQTIELAEKLEERGFAASAINGDIPQNLREKTVERLKNGQIDVLIATDVVARGLDVKRISHVINYDIPFDTEAYIHRIGRTGRAGRTGDAILFVAPRERRMLRSIEKATRQPITPIELPTIEQINSKRVERLKEKLLSTAENDGTDEIVIFRDLLAQFEQETDLSALDLAARMAVLMQQGQPFFLQKQKKGSPKAASPDHSGEKRGRRRTESGQQSQAPERSDAPRRKPRRSENEQQGESIPMENFRIEVGLSHGVKAGNIVGAIANEAGLESSHIQKLKINDNFSTVQLPAGMPRSIFKTLRKTWVCGQQLAISPLDGKPTPPSRDTRNEAEPRQEPRKKLKIAKKSDNRTTGKAAPAKKRPQKKHQSRKGKPSVKS